MRYFKFFVYCNIIIFILYGEITFGEEIEIPSSLNPVGSGGRPIAMGGAYISIADDLTAHIWNSGAFRPRHTELGIVLNSRKLREDINFGQKDNAFNSNTFSEIDIDFIGATFPFDLFSNKWCLSFVFQNIYKLHREWNFKLKESNKRITEESDWHYIQDGNLSIVGVIISHSITADISYGLSFNFWNDLISPNKWEQKYYKKREGLLFDEIPSYNELFRKRTFHFKGFNLNFGLLWDITRNLSFGLNIKSPFTADIQFTSEMLTITIPPDDPPDVYPDSETREDELEMPVSYGIGMSYQVSDYLTIASDIYRTEWDEFTYREQGGFESCPITGLPKKNSDINPTYHVRVGIEYTSLLNNNFDSLSYRAGLFYDPAPAQGTPENYFGISLGLGFTKNSQFSFDTAYQYRYGKNVGKSLMKNLDFSQNIQEHSLFSSINFYYK